MTPLAVVGLVVCLVGLLAFMYGEWRDVRRIVWVAKPLASAGFITLAVGGGALDTPFGLAVLVALVLSFVGDVLLIPADPRAFLGGLGAFLLGHVGFTAAFFVHGVSLGVAGAGLVALVPVALVVARWLLPHVDAKMRIPVLAYMTAISAMVAASFGAAAAHPNGLELDLAGAAILFFVSDLSVARDRFIAPGFVNRLWGLPLYYGAQIWFALQVAPGR